MSMRYKRPGYTGRPGHRRRRALRLLRCADFAHGSPRQHRQRGLSSGGAVVEAIGRLAGVSAGQRDHFLGPGIFRQSLTGTLGRTERISHLSIARCEKQNHGHSAATTQALLVEKLSDEAGDLIIGLVKFPASGTSCLYAVASLTLTELSYLHKTTKVGGYAEPAACRSRPGYKCHAFRQSEPGLRFEGVAAV